MRRSIEVSRFAIGSFQLSTRDALSRDDARRRTAGQIVPAIKPLSGAVRLGAAIAWSALPALVIGHSSRHSVDGQPLSKAVVCHGGGPCRVDMRAMDGGIAD